MLLPGYKTLLLSVFEFGNLWSLHLVFRSTRSSKRSTSSMCHVHHQVKSTQALSIVIIIKTLLMVAVTAETPFCELYKSANITAVTPLKNKLIIIADDLVYTLPFASSHINSKPLRRIKAYGPRLSSLGHWNQVTTLWSGNLSNNTRKQTLRQLNILPVLQYTIDYDHMRHGYQALKPPFIDVVLSDTDGGRIHYSRLLNVSETPETEKIQDQDQYALWSDGNATGWLIRETTKNEAKQLVFAPMGFVKCYKNGEYDFPPLIKSRSGSNLEIFYQTTLQPSGMQVHFREYGVGSSIGKPLLNAPGPGFIFAGTAHYWNLDTREVFLFKLPKLPVEKDAFLSKSIFKIPMAEYFACNDAAWNAPPPTLPPWILVTSQAFNITVSLGVAIICSILLIVLLGALWFVLSSGKSKKSGPRKKRVIRFSQWQRNQGIEQEKKGKAGRRHRRSNFKPHRKLNTSTEEPFGGLTSASSTSSNSLKRNKGSSAKSKMSPRSDILKSPGGSKTTSPSIMLSQKQNSFSKTIIFQKKQPKVKLRVSP